MQKRGKKGISEVIVSVLMILLVIAAIAIFWVVIRNLINSSTEEISSGLNLIDLKIVNNMVSEADNKAIVNVKRSIGSGNLSEIKFLFDTVSGNQFSIIQDTVMGELEQNRFELVLPKGVSHITKIKIIPGIKINGKNKFGSLSDESIRSNPPNLILNPDITSSAWIGYWVKPIIISGKTDLFGGTGAYQLEPADHNSTDPFSGIIYLGHLSEGKKYTISCWIRTISGTLIGKLGFTNSQSGPLITMNTTWQLFNYTTTIAVDGGGRSGQIIEGAFNSTNGGTQPSWQIAFPEVHETL